MPGWCALGDFGGGSGKGMESEMGNVEDRGRVEVRKEGGTAARIYM